MPFNIKVNHKSALFIEIVPNQSINLRLIIRITINLLMVQTRKKE